MLTVRQKRRLTYCMIGLFFLFGGVEYAVILPTIWLYLQETFHAPQYYLGLVLSAFSLADMIAGPFIGRWSDRTGNTKLILLIANVPQIVGSLMYCAGFSAPFLVASRFITGLGSSVAAALMADIARVTTSEERTAVLAVFMAVRQVGLLVGPGFNLFLRLVDFKVGPFIVDAYRAPGLFMACLWVVHEILAVFFYWNLPTLLLEEQLEGAQYSPHPSCLTPATTIAGRGAGAAGGSCTDPTQSLSAASTAALAQTQVPWDASLFIDPFVDDPATLPTDPDDIPSMNLSLQRPSSPNSSRAIQASDDSHLIPVSSREVEVEASSGVEADAIILPGRRRISTIDQDSTEVENVSSSNEFIEQAEDLMAGFLVPPAAGPAATPRRLASVGADFSRTHSAPNLASSPLTARSADPALGMRGSRSHYGAMLHTEPNARNRVSNGSASVNRIQEDAMDGEGGVYGRELGGERGSVASVRALQNTLAVVAIQDGSRPFGYYINEFLREETVAILTMVFVAFFNQMCLETLITPLTNRLLGWREVENSILYCVCAVEVIAMFLLIRVLSRRVMDRAMMLLGFLLETTIIAFFIWFIPQALPGNSAVNLPILIVTIFIDLMGLPLLVVTSNSLYSKITRKETQGVAQGIRRIFMGYGTLLGPLWASSMFSQPYIMFSVMLAVNLVAMCMLLLSYKRLRESVNTNNSSIDKPTCTTDNSTETDSERQPLLQT